MIKNIKSDFGAVGGWDGVNDDSSAFIRAAEYVRNNPGSTIVYPRGRYSLDRSYGFPGRSIKYSGSNFKLTFEPGAVVSVKGDFHRKAAVGTKSDLYPLTPFEFVNCSDFVVEGLHLEGNVFEMSRDPGVGSSAGHGILTRNCDRYTLQHIRIHGMSSDGIYLGAGDRPDTDADIYGVKSLNNGRSALTIGLMHDAFISKFNFSGTGDTGLYGSDGPRCGVNIEPSARGAEHITQNVTFNKGRIYGSFGSQFVCNGQARVENVILDEVLIRANASSSSRVVILGLVRAAMRNCEVHTEYGAIYPNYGAKTPQTPVSTVIEDCAIYTKAQGIFSVGYGPLTITRNRLIGQDGLNTFLPHLSHREAVFTHNTVFIPREMVRPNYPASHVQFAAEASHNVFLTDSLDGGPQVSYKETKWVENETYFGVTPRP